MAKINLRQIIDSQGVKLKQIAEWLNLTQEEASQIKAGYVLPSFEEALILSKKLNVGFCEMFSCMECKALCNWNKKVKKIKKELKQNDN